MLADGREIPLPKDAVFKRRTSRSGKRFVSSIVFPGVEVGAVLDYKYRLRAVSLFSLEPWYFQEEVPTVYSEVVYDIPSVVTVRFLHFGPAQDGHPAGTPRRLWTADGSGPGAETFRRSRTALRRSLRGSGGAGLC